jgi:23S rRNA (pseudouridine1915-N3)-methyltransferase
MKIKLLAIGKTDNKHLIQLIEEYQNRLKHYIKFELEIIPDIKNVKNLSEIQQKDKEGELILLKLQNTDQLVLLDDKGKDFSSIQFSQYLQKKMNSGIKQLVLFIVEQLYRGFTILKNEPYHHE